jgi:hypothetical protein
MVERAGLGPKVTAVPRGVMYDLGRAIQEFQRSFVMQMLEHWKQDVQDSVMAD